MELKGKRTLVTGGHGFLGTHLVNRFEAGGADVVAPRHADYDLTDAAEVGRMFEEIEPEVVVHAAADVGGLGYNRLYPADIFRNNLLMGCHVLKGCTEADVEKLVIIGSACAYPGEVAGTMHEEDFLEGAMHPSVECYGFSKRALFLGARAHGQQHGLDSVFMMLTNLYGPHDKFDPEESHVVAALIRKFVLATDEGAERVECWGTGAPIREFLYAPDCADAVWTAAQECEELTPLNIGTGIGTSIRELAEMIAELTGFGGEIYWDTSKPDGAMKKVLDVSRVKDLIGWEAETALCEGLSRTIEWYRENRPA